MISVVIVFSVFVADVVSLCIVVAWHVAHDIVGLVSSNWPVILGLWLASKISYPYSYEE